MDKRLERILPRVQKPARYTGGEYKQIMKDRDKVDIRLAFCFPDTYEIGMSNLGMSILYHTMNSLDFVWCERCFAPWGDMYEEMKKAGIPLYALESGDPLSAFDSLAFSVGYEMAYTTVLDMIDMAGLPLRSADLKGDFQISKVRPVVAQHRADRGKHSVHGQLLGGKTVFLHKKTPFVTVATKGVPFCGSGSGASTDCVRGQLPIPRHSRLNTNALFLL